MLLLLLLCVIVIIVCCYSRVVLFLLCCCVRLLMLFNDFFFILVLGLSYQILSREYSGPEKHVWFYLRDEYYAESINKEDRHVYQSEGEYEYSKLKVLKKDLMSSKYPSRSYHRPSHFSTLVYEDLEAHINKATTI